jgi:hypothetical protein
MVSTQGFWLALGYFILRFGLPLIVTLIVCRLFQILDHKWQAEGEEYRKVSGVDRLIPVLRCWVLNDCPESKRNICPAYLEQNTPCWQQFRAKNGEVKEKCIGCGVLRGAPVPFSGD